MKEFIVKIEDLHGSNRHIIVSEFDIFKGRIQERIVEKFPKLDNVTAYYLVGIEPRNVQD